MQPPARRREWVQRVRALTSDVLAIWDTPRWCDRKQKWREWVERHDARAPSAPDFGEFLHYLDDFMCDGELLQLLAADFRKLRNNQTAKTAAAVGEVARFLREAQPGEPPGAPVTPPPDQQDVPTTSVLTERAFLDRAASFQDDAVLDALVCPDEGRRLARWALWAARSGFADDDACLDLATSLEDTCTRRALCDAYQSLRAKQVQQKADAEYALCLARELGAEPCS